MKVKIRNYTSYSRLTYRIIPKILFFLSDEKADNITDKIANTSFGEKVDQLSEKFSDWMEKRRVDVTIDYYDTFSADHTLSVIIHPLLEKIKECKNGSPWVDDFDVPIHLRSMNDVEHVSKFDANFETWDTDKLFHDRWEWVISEMVWVFSEDGMNDDDIEYGSDEYIEFYSRRKHAMYLFAKYYQCLWT